MLQTYSALFCHAFGRGNMKAIGYKTPLPIEDPQSLLDIEMPVPEVKGRDLLVEVKAISVNPGDKGTRHLSHRIAVIGMPSLDLPDFREED